MFDALNRSFAEFSQQQTNEIIIPTKKIVYHILRRNEMYLIILTYGAPLPNCHLQVARYVLEHLNLQDN